MWSFMSSKLLGIATNKLKLEEDNKFQSLSCQIRSNMETTLHVNDYKFHKPRK